MSQTLVNIRNLIAQKRVEHPRLYDALEKLIGEDEALDTRAQDASDSLNAQLAGKAASGATVLWSQVDKTGSSLADLATRSASALNAGVLPDAQLAGTYNSSVAFAASTNTFRGAYK